MPQAQNPQALHVARLYYYQNLNTSEIAQQLGLSRPKVSRLLNHARDVGMVEIRIIEGSVNSNLLADNLAMRFGLQQLHVVEVNPAQPESTWLAQVAQFAARHISALVQTDQTLGIAWGATLNAISAVLPNKPLYGVKVVQLNGSGSATSLADSYSSDIVQRFAKAFSGHAFPFPVPAFFDFAESKTALWRERSVRQLLAAQQNADMLIFSIGTPHSSTPSHVYAQGYLSAQDIETLAHDQVVGDIATVFFRADGSHHGIALNKRASGPDLDSFVAHPNSLCVVSGFAKVPGLAAALAGRFIKQLIIDAPTLRALMKFLEKNPT